MLSVKQGKFILARIAAYDERLKVLETRIQELDGCRVPGLDSPVPVGGKLPDEQD